MTQNYYSGLTSELLKVQRSKQHSPIFKTFLNNNKISIILPLFYENEFVPDFKKKAGLFDSTFAEQCSLLTTVNYPPDSKLRSITLRKNVYQPLNSHVTIYSI